MRFMVSIALQANYVLGVLTADVSHIVSKDTNHSAGWENNSTFEGSCFYLGVAKPNDTGKMRALVLNILF